MIYGDYLLKLSSHTSHGKVSLDMLRFHNALICYSFRALRRPANLASKITVKFQQQPFFRCPAMHFGTISAKELMREIASRRALTLT